MKIGVVGLWHLGSVTAACLAKAGFEVIAYDRDAATIANLKNHQAPIFEPGLDELLNQANLQFTTDPAKLAQASLIWIAYDTPVDDNDHADVDFVKQEVMHIFPYLMPKTLVLISSQLPVGSTHQLKKQCDQQFAERHIRFAYTPENLRLGKAIEIFTHPDRIVVGIDQEEDKALLLPVLEKFSTELIWMSVPSAEMTKHALNAFLAASVVFINELSSLCEYVGANAYEVEQGLKSEVRIGPRAYLHPGNAFAGGTLARDVTFLKEIGQQYQFPTYLFDAILDSNQHHKAWLQRRLTHRLGSLANKTITLLGLTYKPDTDTLRRSEAIQLSYWLHQQGATIQAYDPAIKALPAELQHILLKNESRAALANADAVVIATQWAEFKSLTAHDFIKNMQKAIIFDVHGHLPSCLANNTQVQYFTVGKTQ